MATHGEQAAARLIEKLEQLEAEFEHFVDSVKSEYDAWWDKMSRQEMDDFVRLLDLNDHNALRQFIVSRGQKARACLFPRWMLEDE